MSHRKRSGLVRLLRYALLALVTAVMVLAYQVWSYRTVRDDAAADAAVVLGAAVWGKDPSPVLEQRILHAIALFRTERVRALVFTGGKGEGERLAEAEVARRYAIEQGVPSEHIVIETRSQTTEENLENAKRIAQLHEFDRVLIVSDPLHMKRAMALADSVGLDARPSPTQTSRSQGSWAQGWMLARETYFYGRLLVEHHLGPLLRDATGEADSTRAAF